MKVSELGIIEINEAPPLLDLDAGGGRSAGG